MTGDGLDKARDLLAEGMTEDAARLLRTIVEGLAVDDVVAAARVREVQRDVVVQLGFAALLRQSVRRGELSPDDEVRQRKRLNYALLELADEIEQVAAREDVIAAAAMP